MAWDAVPMARPLATGSCIRITLHTEDAIIFPKTPVMIIIATVMVTMPPYSSEMPMPMAVVIDLGSRVIYICLSSPKAFDNSHTRPMLVTTPDAMPAIMAAKCLLSSSSLR